MPMTVGILCFELHIPGARSLKHKRKVVKSLIDRLHHRYRLSIAETDFHDLHQRTEIGIAAVANGRGELDRLFAGMRRIVDAEHEAMVTSWQPQTLETDG